MCQLLLRLIIQTLYTNEPVHQVKNDMWVFFSPHSRKIIMSDLLNKPISQFTKHAQVSTVPLVVVVLNLPPVQVEVFLELSSTPSWPSPSSSPAAATPTRSTASSTGWAPSQVHAGVGPVAPSLLFQSCPKCDPLCLPRVSHSGVASCVLLFEKVVPFLSGKTPVGPDVPVVQKQKTQQRPRRETFVPYAFNSMTPACSYLLFLSVR